MKPSLLSLVRGSPAPVAQADLLVGAPASATQVASWAGFADGAAAELEARRMFQSTLAHWARDVLTLRRRGLDTPGRRTGSARAATPGLGATAYRKAA